MNSLLNFNSVDYKCGDLLPLVSRSEKEPMKLAALLIPLILLFCQSVIGHDHPYAHITEPDYKPPSTPVIIGDGAFRYQLVPGWATRNAETHKLGHGHAIAEDSAGRILFLNASAEYCMIILDKQGKLLEAWGTFAPGAHGLTIVEENGHEVLFITDNSKNGKVFKTTLEGDILMTLSYPEASGLYISADDFRPSETMHLPNGDFYVIDGYGKDYIHRYNADGTYLSSFGGDIGKGEARLEHWGPHGGGIDLKDTENPTIILALSDRNRIKRFTVDGSWLETIQLPGGNPRDIIFHRDHMVVPHLGDRWPTDRNAAGYLSVLDRKFRVIANLGGTPPSYDETGRLKPMSHSSHLFHHPHGACFDSEESLYVAQFASNGTWPLKFVRLKD